MTGKREIRRTDRRRLARVAGSPVSELQRQRVKRGWTQREVGAFVAALIGRPEPFSGGYIHRIEIGEYVLTSPELRAAIAKLFAIDDAALSIWLQRRPLSTEAAA